MGAREDYVENQRSYEVEVSPNPAESHAFDSPIEVGNEKVVFRVYNVGLMT